MSLNLKEALLLTSGGLYLRSRGASHPQSYKTSLRSVASGEFLRTAAAVWSLASVTSFCLLFPLQCAFATEQLFCPGETQEGAVLWSFPEKGVAEC